MKDETRQEYLDGNGRKGEHIVCQEAGGKHVRGGDGGDVKAAQNPLFAEHHQRGAESPEAAHDVESDDGTQKITNGEGIAAGENYRIKKKHAERKEHAEKTQHFIAQCKHE